MKKLTIFTNHYYPENFRINALSKQFLSDFDVDVVTQVPNYPKGDFYSSYSNFKRKKETIDGVHVRRLFVIPRKRNPIMLTLNYISYAISSYLFGLFSKKDSDHVMVYATSPLFLAWGALRLAKRSKAKTTLYLLDLWPDSLVMALNLKNEYLINKLQKSTLKIYKKFDTIVVSSHCFIDDLVKRGIDPSKIVHIPQHADELLDASIEIPKVEDKVKIVFTGNVGQAQGLDILVEAGKILIADNFTDFIITIVGDGRYRDELEDLISENNLSDYFIFTGQVDVQDVKGYLQSNHFGFVSLLNKSPLDKTLPAKIQSYMSYGIPILASADGEIPNVIKMSESGIWAKAEDAQDLADKIKSIKVMSYEALVHMGANGYRYSLSNYDIEKISKQFIHIMKEGK